MRSPLRDAATLRPEHRLLIALVTAQINGGQSQPMREVLAKGLDWRLVLDAACEHRVAALCYPRLLVTSEPAVPAEILDAFRRHAIATAARNLRLASRLVEITQRAERAGIPLIPYKGAVLAQLAYGDLGLREFVDLDFIVPQQRLAETAKLLEGLGYRAETPALLDHAAPIPGEYIFLAGETDFHIELHTEFTLRHFPVRPNLEALTASRQAIAVAGHRVSTFTSENTLTLLAVHGAKDFWAELLWIGDVAALIRSPGFDWDRALEGASRMRCLRMVNVALLLAVDLLDAQIPARVMRRAEADILAGRQAGWVAERLFAPQAFGRMEHLGYRMRTADGFWLGVRYLLRLAMTPAEDDWQAMRLPRPLGFAYPFLRPLRVFWRSRRQEFEDRN